MNDVVRYFCLPCAKNALAAMEDQREKLTAEKVELMNLLGQARVAIDDLDVTARYTNLVLSIGEAIDP